MASSTEGHQRAAAAPAEATPTAASLSTHRLGVHSPSQACFWSPHIWLKSVERTLGLCSGALDGGSPMSQVDFKIWQCRMALLLISPTVTCRI